LYSRFFTRVLRDMGLVDHAEPFPRLFNQGIVLGPDGHRMSKSRGNVIDPDDLVEHYGADVVRGYLMFMRPWDQGGPWQPGGIDGVANFLNRVWRIAVDEEPAEGDAPVAAAAEAEVVGAAPFGERELRKLTHRTIKKVTEDLSEFRFNTAIAAMMEFSRDLARAREARLHIIEKMLECIKEPRPQLSPYAPRITMIHIDPSKIGTVIGPGGKTIRKIVEESGARIDVEDDGTVCIAATEGVGGDRAVQMIRELVEEPEIGKIYTGRVVRTTDFGAFVQILPGKDGLVHISQLADYRVPSVEDVVHVGDEIMVMVIDIDPEGKIKLSRQAVLEGWTAEEARERDRRAGRPAARPAPRREARRPGRGGAPPRRR
ncbi:MAG: S1 RNA-binding domain-containing protein, partial [Anaerolineae bacterium]|nr:S1 RNA-binding domain-containing protein [Anaerolineae bacterium]